MRMFSQPQTTIVTKREKVAELPLHQLMGRHGRLTRELSAARSTRPLYAGLIRRLRADLAATEQEIAQMLPAERSMPAPVPRRAA